MSIQKCISISHAPTSEGTETMQSGTFLYRWNNSKLCNYYNYNSTFWQDALPNTINCSHLWKQTSDVGPSAHHWVTAISSNHL